MKKLYATLLLGLLFNLVNAQNERYDFTNSIEPYEQLTNATAVDFGPTDDWADFDELLELELEFGFSVPILGFPSIGMFNFLSPELLISSFDEEADDPILPFLVPTTTQLQNRGVIDGNDPSEIYYQTTGAPGSQIFKLEYRDVGFANESFSEPSTQNMFTNMQVWIYEETGCIEYRYGETSITDPDLIYDGDNGSGAGLSRALSSQLDGDTVLYAIFTTGDAQNPGVFEGENTDEEIGLDSDGFPGNGVVYTFCPEIEVSTTNLNDNLDWEVYPNPTLDFLTVKLNEVGDATYRIIGMNGQTISTGMINPATEKIEVSSLNKGIYMLTIQTEKGMATKRFWKR